MKCQNDLADCECPDIAERMRSVTEAGKNVALGWCKRCDTMYRLCKCAEGPDMAVRADGGLSRHPDDPR